MSEEVVVQEAKNKNIKDVSVKENKQESKYGFLISFLLKILIIIVVLVLCNFFIVKFHRVSENNMFPMVKERDLCVFYCLDKPQLNHVVLYKTPEGEQKIGRIVAIPSQTVDFPKNGGYLINGYMQNEEIFYPTYKDSDSAVKYPLILSEDNYFIMNDFRSDLKDSRKYGEINKKNIIGRVIFIFRRKVF